MSEQQPIIQQALALVVDALKAQQILPADWVDNSTISRTKDQSHGDFASNLAMVAAKIAKKNPRELAQQIVALLLSSDMISKVDIAGPGFINFFLEDLEDLLGESLEDPIKWKKTRRVPLLFHLPLKAGLSVQSDVNTGQMDILPTVAGLMGIKYKTAFGKDLLSLNDREPLIFRNGSYIYKNIFVEPGVERATALDDGERRDIKQYDNITADVEKRLEYNDLIQEKNLIEPILRDSN